MSFIKDMGDAIGQALRGHVGGNVVQGAQEGKTAQQITAMLSGVTRATGRAPQTSDLPQRKTRERAGDAAQSTMGLPQRRTPNAGGEGGAARWAAQSIKIFPNSVTVQKAAAQERSEEINIRHAAAGRKKLGIDATDPAFLSAISQAGAPSRRTPMGRLGPRMADPAFLRTIAQAGKPPVREQKQTDKKLLGVLGRLATKLPGWLKIAGVAVVASAAVVKLPSIIRNMATGRLQEQATLSRFSGTIARTTALMKVQDIHLGLRQARATGKATERLGSAARELRDTLQPYGGAWDSLKTNVSFAITKGMNEAIEGIEYIMTLGNPELIKRALEGEKDPQGIPFEQFLRKLNPVAQPRNAGVPLDRRDR